MKENEKAGIAAAEVNFMRQTAKCTWMYHKINKVILIN
jgi:hypothetical protein